jgi:hypothetical protein
VENFILTDGIHLVLFGIKNRTLVPYVMRALPEGLSVRPLRVLIRVCRRTVGACRFVFPLELTHRSTGSLHH